MTHYSNFEKEKDEDIKRREIINKAKQFGKTVEGYNIPVLYEREIRALAQIKGLRDSGKIVHLFGTLLSNVPDYNGSQIQLDRIVIEE